MEQRSKTCTFEAQKLLVLMLGKPRLLFALSPGLFFDLFQFHRLPLRLPHSLVECPSLLQREESENQIRRLQFSWSTWGSWLPGRILGVLQCALTLLTTGRLEQASAGALGLCCTIEQPWPHMDLSGIS